MNDKCTDIVDIKIDSLIQQLNKYKYISEEDFQVKKHVTHLQIRAFDTIVSSCKDELLDADENHLKYILKTMCNVDLDSNDTSLIESQIKSFLANYLDENNGSVSINSYEVLCEKSVIEMIHLNDFTKSYLAYLINSIHPRNKFLSYVKQDKSNENWIRQKDRLQCEYEIFLQNLNYAIDNVIHRIVENFYMVYIFLEAMLLYSNLKNDISLKMVLLSQLDRILDIVNPTILEKSLNNDDLLYYHLFYELKEIRFNLVNSL